MYAWHVLILIDNRILSVRSESKEAAWIVTLSKELFCTFENCLVADILYLLQLSLTKVVLKWYLNVLRCVVEFTTVYKRPDHQTSQAIFLHIKSKIRLYPTAASAKQNHLTTYSTHKLITVSSHDFTELGISLSNDKLNFHLR